MLQVHVDIDEVILGLDRLEALPDRGFMQAVADELLARQVERFRRKVDPRNRPWKPWARGSGPKSAGHTLMHRTGKLEGSFRVAAVTSDSAEVGTSIPYSNFHQDGSRRLPKREVLGVGTGDRQAVRAEAFAYIEGELHGLV